MRKAVVFLADGFEECEGLIVVDILRRAGIKVMMASVMGRLNVDSSRHVIIRSDILHSDINYSDVDMIILPGGRVGTENLSKDEIVKEQCHIFAENKTVAAICAAPSLLASMGLLEGRRATCHPDFEEKMAGCYITGDAVTVDRNIITGQGLAASFQFALEIVKMMVSEEKAENIATAICYRN